MYSSSLPCAGGGLQSPSLFEAHGKLQTEGGLDRQPLDYVFAMLLTLLSPKDRTEVGWWNSRPCQWFGVAGDRL